MTAHVTPPQSPSPGPEAHAELSASSAARPDLTSPGGASSAGKGPTAAPKDISVSPAAVEAIAGQIKKRGIPDTALRVGVRGGGCSGFSYVIEFHDGPPRARDRLYEYQSKDGSTVKVVVDPKSLVYLDGAVLEWEDRLIRRGFKWANPQEQAGCGCGHSFAV